MKAVEFSAVRVKKSEEQQLHQVHAQHFVAPKIHLSYFCKHNCSNGFISMKNIIFIFLLMVTHIKNDTMLKYLNEGIQCFDTCLAVYSVK